MLLSLALQEKRNISRNLEKKIQALSQKFETFVRTVHHLCFVESSLPHYELLKQRSKLHRSAMVKAEAGSSEASPPTVGPPRCSPFAGLDGTPERPIHITEEGFEDVDVEALLDL